MTDPPSTPLHARLRELRQHIGPNAQNQMTCLYGDATLREISNVLVEAADQLEDAHAETTRLRQERENIVVAVLRSLPDDMPPPSIVMEQDGEIGLDWNRSFEDRTVAYILSITPEDMKLEIESNLRMQMQSWASPGAPRTA